jgi:integrase
LTEPGYKSLENWLGRLSHDGARNGRYVFNNWVKWVRVNGSNFAQSTPDELVSFQAEAVGRDKYAILDLVQAYVGTLSGRRGSIKNKYTVIRSFFLHNRAELPSDRSFKVKGTVPKVNGDLKPEEFRSMVLSCNPVFRALFLCMGQGFMGEGEAIYWNKTGWAKLREDLKADPDIVRVDLPGRKSELNEKNYYTLIGPDAISALRLWLNERPSGAAAIFTNQHGDPLSKKAIYLYWHRHLLSLGLISKGVGPTNRSGKNPHEIRDTFRSLWSKSPAKATVAEFMMQHETDPNEYDKAFRDEPYMRSEYRKALPWLNLMSSSRPYGQVSEDRIIELERQLEAAKAGQNGRVAELEAKQAAAEAENAETIKALIEEIQGIKKLLGLDKGK